MDPAIHQRKKPTAEKTTKNSNDPVKESKNVATGSVIKTASTVLCWSVVLFFMTSYLITESWTWGYRGKWTNVNTYIPRKNLALTEKELAKHDGSNPNLPIYIAIDGDVYDVSAGAGWYGLGASYHHFAGRDAARAYVTGCFEDHLTHDLRGLSEAQLKGVEHWKKFYENHHTYHKVGRVLHTPIPDDAPIPKPCKQSVGQKP